MSSFYIVTLLLILTLLPFSTPNPLLDVDGDLIINGASYYIVESLPFEIGKGVTYTQRTNDECPLYITRANQNGTPVMITSGSPLLTPFIFEDLPITLSFTDSQQSIPCKESSLEWKLTMDFSSGKKYVTTGGGNSGIHQSHFVVQNWGTFLSTLYYVLQSNNSNIGYMGDGFLGVTRRPISVLFKRAFVDSLEISAS